MGDLVARMREAGLTGTELDRLPRETDAARSKRVRGILQEKGIEFPTGIDVEDVQRSADLVRKADQTGIDVSECDKPTLDMLRKVAAGNLLPEVVVRFAGMPFLMKRIGNLSLDEQRRLANGGLVQLVTLKNDQPTSAEVDPLGMHHRDVLQVFATDHIRGEREQHFYLITKSTEKCIRELQS